MTDTLITVDVSSAALISRAKDGQAVARENLLRVERERQERKKQEKARRERLDREQADRLGRSRLRKGGRREEVAAGYVERYSLATGFIQEIAYESLGPVGIVDRSYPGRVVVKIWSYDQQSTATFEPSFGQEYYQDVPQFQLTGYQTYQPLPVGPDSFILWCQKRLTGPNLPSLITDNQCFLMTRRSVKKIGTPPGADQLFAGYGPIGTIVESPGYAGSPRSIERLLGIEYSTPPSYLKLNQQITLNSSNQIVDVARNMTGAVHRQADYLDTGRPAAWLRKKARVDSEEIVSVTASNYSATFNPATDPAYASFPLIAWDWGKPQLCRRLLLQLGFRPEDLRP